MIIHLKEENKKVYISEGQLLRLNEDVFVSGVKGHKAKLSYNKRQSDKAIRNLGNYNSFDMVNTNKMDQNNHDTYIVPLKGGLKSYNITSIRGTEVMHYFKNKFSNKKTTMKIKVNGEESEFDLMMEDSEFLNFLDVFAQKVSNVVNYVSNEYAAMDKDFNGFKGVSIYGVPSSSNFNSCMAEALVKKNVGISNLPCIKVDDALFKKDLTNLQKDSDFINKNKEYYQGSYFTNSDKDKRTHIDLIDDTIDKFKDTTSAQDEELINNYNNCVRRVLTSYYQKVSTDTLARNYVNLVNAMRKIREKLDKKRWDNALSKIKYAKGASIDKRTKAIRDMVTPILGKTYVSANEVDIVAIEPKAFQIKNLTNDVRMGLKNFFKVNDNVQEELERIKGTVFVIFDDNISGGATLSDICMQAKNLGIKYIIPITFGEMATKYTYNRFTINKPKQWNY